MTTLKRNPDAPEFLSEPEEMEKVELESQRLRRQAARWGAEIPEEFWLAADDGALFIGGAYHTHMALKIRDANETRSGFGSVAWPSLY